jgi:hypothetical protein
MGRSRGQRTTVLRDFPTQWNQTISASRRGELHPERRDLISWIICPNVHNAGQLREKATASPRSQRKVHRNSCKQGGAMQRFAGQGFCLLILLAALSAAGWIGIGCVDTDDPAPDRPSPVATVRHFCLSKSLLSVVLDDGLTYLHFKPQTSAFVLPSVSPRILSFAALANTEKDLLGLMQQRRV